MHNSYIGQTARANRFSIQFTSLVRITCNIGFFKGVQTRSRVDALSELYLPFLKGDNSAFIAAISKEQILVIRIATARMDQIELSNLITFTPS